ncbi:restriction endonuclease [Mesobacillus sp. S13]|uniref:restriction endonuclease n=1 Tax=Mesobacillus sp. S13 TaxID=2880221 RepID=UPI001CF5EF0B|nr:restriction endonuclease [Mesobacillus sp. S13]
MSTAVGRIKLWDEDIEGYKDGELILNEYTAKVTHLDGSGTIIELAEKIEYIVEIDSEYNDIVYVKRNSGHTLIIFNLSGVGRRKERLQLIKEHYKNLNLLLGQRQREFSDNVETIYNNTINSNEILQIVYNYIERTSKSVFTEPLFFICFERLLYFKNSLGKYTLTTTSEHEPLLTFNSVVERFEDEVEFSALMNYYDEYFIKLVKILNKRISFDLENEGIFVTWKLLRDEICHYYYNKFNQSYGGYIPNIDKLSLDECVQSYTDIDLLDFNSGENASMYIYYLMYVNKFEDNNNYIINNDTFLRKLVEVIERKELDSFESSLTESSRSTSFTIDNIDLMNGLEFESFISDLFTKMGYSTKVTKGSGDQGIDVIVEKHGNKIGVQTKCYANSVNNKAIQEVVAGLKYYNLTKGIVVTNNFFTESAKELAISNDVILWDRSILKEKISEVFINY